MRENNSQGHFHLSAKLQWVNFSPQYFLLLPFVELNAKRNWGFLRADYLIWLKVNQSCFIYKSHRVCSFIFTVYVTRMIGCPFHLVVVRLTPWVGHTIKGTVKWCRHLMSLRNVASKVMVCKMKSDEMNPN